MNGTRKRKRRREETAFRAFVVGGGFRVLACDTKWGREKYVMWLHVSGTKLEKNDRKKEMQGMKFVQSEGEKSGGEDG